MNQIKILIFNLTIIFTKIIYILYELFCKEKKTQQLNLC